MPPSTALYRSVWFASLPQCHADRRNAGVLIGGGDSDRAASPMATLSLQRQRTTQRTPCALQPLNHVQRGRRHAPPIRAWPCSVRLLPGWDGSRSHATAVTGADGR